jgi:hypothetical protein
MRADIGDWLVVNSRNDSVHARRAKILDVGRDGAPPYTVRWADTDHVTIVFPGPDAEVVTMQRLEELDRVRGQQISAVQSAIRTARPQQDTEHGAGRPG